MMINSVWKRVLVVSFLLRVNFDVLSVETSNNLVNDDISQRNEPKNWKSGLESMFQRIFKAGKTSDQPASKNAVLEETDINRSEQNMDQIKPGLNYDEKDSKNKRDKKEARKMVTLEELSRMNGSNENKTIWIAIMSEIYDVSIAPNFYANGSTYHIFAGREANVPFVTGIFTEEEAAKSISTLDSHNLFLVENFLNDTYKPEKPKYPFIGYLIGELYTEDGKRTVLLREILKEIKKEKKAKDDEERLGRELREQYKRELAQQEQNGQSDDGAGEEADKYEDESGEDEASSHSSEL